jgi:hypothetical protein
MASIKVYLSTGYTRKDNKRPVYIRFYVNKEQVVIPCGLAVKECDFNHETGKIKLSCKEHRDNNLIIENIRSRINDIMVRYRLRRMTLTKDAFMKEYNRPHDFATFFDFFDNYIQMHPAEIEMSTLDVHIDVMNKLKRYTPTLHFDDITEEFMLDFKRYLKTKLKNKDSTIIKNLAVIKKYCRRAIKYGYMIHNPFENIKISRNTKCDFSFLTEDELKKMLSLYRERSLSSMHQ